MNTFHKVMAFSAIALCSFAVRVQAENSLRLQDAIKSTLQHNPQLAGYEFRTKALAGEQQTAALKPQLKLSTHLENIAGSGDFKGVDASELTLSLSSVIELGGQRDARLGLVTARQQQLASTQRVLTLDLLTQVTQQFIAIVAAQEQLKLLQQSQQLAQENVTSLTKQVQVGRTPEAELLRAKASLARALIDVQKTQQQLKSESVKLSAFWASSQSTAMQPTFTQVEADLFSLPPLVPLPTLISKLDANPDLAVLGDEVHLRAAELKQAQADRKANLEWSAGVRRLQVSDDSALVLGVSMPLGSANRASGAIATASANQAGAEQEQNVARIKLHTQLISLHGAYEQALAEVTSLRNHVLPLLKQALRATADGFQQGRYNYLELNLAQRELLNEQLTLIKSAARAHELSADIERITGAALTSVPQQTSAATLLP
ncbi:MAG TPA: TolC family protein [Cellvibrio sp.]|nr:TolC family protein [Cellvibrio sp.]